MSGEVRITMNLSKRAAWAMNLICSATGESKTDAVNDALRLYAAVLQAGPDAQLFIRKPGEDYERIHLP
jgi:hypothetical protein